MNINVNSGGLHGTKLGEAVPVVVSGHPDNSSAPVMVIHHSSTTLENPDGLLAQDPLAIIPGSRQRKRSHLSEEAQAVRRVKVANRMREKRANESEEQKEKRRLREAERMRRKRAQEDETAKEKRRREAADRARLRRAKLTAEEREDERKKAALRMRLRRQNEGEEQKKLRRIKAAERMRKRRANETPEERAIRRSGARVKAKLKKKTSQGDDLVLVKEEEPSINREILPKEPNVLSDHQYLRIGNQIVLSPSRFPSGVTVLGHDDVVSQSPYLAGAILSTVPVSENMSAVEISSPHTQSLSPRSASPPTSFNLQVSLTQSSI